MAGCGFLGLGRSGWTVESMVSGMVELLQPVACQNTCVGVHTCHSCARPPRLLQKEVEQPDGSTAKQREEKAASYVSWDQAVTSSLAGANLRRTSKLYLVLRGEACSTLQNSCIPGHFLQH